jgi:hypothetical protein
MICAGGRTLMVTTRIRKARSLLGLLALAALAAACGGSAEQPEAAVSAAGLGGSRSDSRAVEIAEATLEAMGGREAWDGIRFLEWTYLGRRHYHWDKWEGRVRVRYPMGEQTVVVIWRSDGLQGRAWIDGEPVEDPGRLHDLVEGAHESWVNDSYWLVMPYKLLDPGVILRHAGRGEMLDGRPAERLELTFEGVGLTPRNRFLVYVAEDSGLVEQWDVYGDRDDDEPRFRLPWHDWQPYGPILLSGDRGERQLTGIAVHEALPEGAFDGPEALPAG